MTTCLVHGIQLGFRNCFLSVLLLSCAEKVLVCCLEWSVIMVIGESIYHRAKACLRALYWAINQGKFSNIILVNHPHYWSFLNLMNFRVLDFLLSSSFEFSKPVIRDNSFSILLWHSIDATKRFWQAWRCEAVNVRFFFSFCSEIWLGSVLLLKCESVFVPVIVECLVWMNHTQRVTTLTNIA